MSITEYTALVTVALTAPLVMWAIGFRMGRKHDIRDREALDMFRKGSYCRTLYECEIRIAELEHENGHLQQLLEDEQ